MTTKIIAITAVLVAVAMLAGIAVTTPITTVYAAASETEYTFKCKTGESLATSVNFAVNQGFGE